MCTEPVLPRPQAAAALSKKRQSQSRSRDLDQAQAFSRDDLETAMRAKEDLESVEMASARAAANSGKLTFAQVTDQIWHFSSTDYGPRCRLCDWDDMLEKNYKELGLTFAQIRALAIILYLQRPILVFLGRK